MESISVEWQQQKSYWLRYKYSTEINGSTAVILISYSPVAVAANSQRKQTKYITVTQLHWSRKLS